MFEGSHLIQLEEAIQDSLRGLLEVVEEFHIIELKSLNYVYHVRFLNFVHHLIPKLMSLLGGYELINVWGKEFEVKESHDGVEVLGINEPTWILIMEHKFLCYLRYEVFVGVCSEHLIESLWMSII